MTDTYISEKASFTIAVVNPLITAVVETFSNMAGYRVVRKDLQQVREHHPYHQVTALIQLSGRARGSICLSVSQRTAIALVYKMTEIHETEVTSLVCDTVAEFANVIGGMAKDRLTELGLQLGLPNVVHGSKLEIWYPEDSTPMCVNFSSEIGPLMVTFGFSKS